MSSDPVVVVPVDDEDAATEPVVVIDDDDDCDVVEKISDNQAVDTIILDDDPTIENDFSKMHAIIHNKKHKKKKIKLNPHFLISLKNNKLMDKIVTKCLNMDQNVGMARVINKTLLPLYKDAPVSYKQSGLFRKLLKNTYKLLVKDPDYKFLHIKTLCDEMKSGTIRRKVPFVTLATNLKQNGPDYGREITSSSEIKKTQSNSDTATSVLTEKKIEIKDKSITVIIENEDEENDCDVVIVENSEITTANNNNSLGGIKNIDSNIITSYSCDVIMDSDSSDTELLQNGDNGKENVITNGNQRNSPAFREKEDNNNRCSAVNNKKRKETSANTQSQLNPVNNENVEINVCDEKTALENTLDSSNLITIEVPRMLNSASCEEKTVINKSAQENMGFVSFISGSDNEINISNVTEKRKTDNNKSGIEMYSCYESNKKTNTETDTNNGFGLENAVNRKYNSINRENRLNLEIDAMKGIIRINSVTTKGRPGLKNTASLDNKVCRSQLRLVRNNRLKSVKKHSSVNLTNMNISNRFDDNESNTVVNESAQKNMSFMSIISESDNDTNIHNNTSQNTNAKRRKCESETNHNCHTNENTDVIDLIDSDNDCTTNSNDSNNRNDSMIDKAGINKENYMLNNNADKELSRNNFGGGMKLLIPQNHVEVRINQVSPYEGVSKETMIAELEKAINRCKEKIAILETQEVTNDNAITSPYMRCCAYKKKIVEYYKMICDTVGDCEDFVKRREIRLHVTEGHQPGPAKRLEQFLNDSIDSTGTVPFPDFTDVVACVMTANKEDKLGWKKSRVVQEAAALFRQCGEALRKRRQKREYRDLLSLVKDEPTDDPAETDPVLFAKLEANKHIAKVKEEEILERFVNMEMGRGSNSNMRLDFETNEEFSDSDTDSEADDTVNDRESSNTIENTSNPVNNTSISTINTSVPITKDSNIVKDIYSENCPEINKETSDKREFSIQCEAFETNSYKETENNVTIESSCEENRVIITTSDNQKSSTNNETISNTSNGVVQNIDGQSRCVENNTPSEINDIENMDVKIETEIQIYTNNETMSNRLNGVFENIGSESSCVENNSTSENVLQNDDINNLDVKIEREIKLEPVDVQCMLDELGDGYVSTVFDIEDPFLVIEISSDGYSDDDL